MLISLRAYVVSTALTLLFSGFVFACPQLTREMGLDVWNFLSYDRELQDNLDRKESLEDLRIRLARRLSLKMIVTQELVDGRITLSHASEDFLALNRIHPGIMEMTRINYPADSDEEATALQVIAFANTSMGDRSSQRVEVMHRLEKELDEIRGGCSIHTR